MTEKRLTTGIEIKFPLCFFLNDNFSGDKNEKMDYRNPFCAVRMVASDSEAAKLMHLVHEPSKAKPAPKLPRTLSEEELYKRCQENLASVSEIFSNPEVLYKIKTNLT